MGVHEYRKSRLANSSDNQYAIQFLDGFIQRRRALGELPPSFAPYCTVPLRTKGLNFSFYNGKAFDVFTGLLERPVVEVDDPASRGAVGAGVEVLAVEVGE